MLMMDPDPWVIIWVATTLLEMSTPVRLTAFMFDQRSSGTSAIGPPTKIPALATSTSMRPHRRSTAETADS